MKKYHLGLFLLSCLFLTCSELKRMEERRSHKNEASGDSTSKTAKLKTFPVPGKSRKDIISFFGDARDGGARRHEGIDIGAPKGTPVVSVSAGVVKRVVEKGNGGKQVWIEDRSTSSTFYYAHLDSQLVEEGQRVTEGQQIGTVGNTGNASKGPPHLHFEVINKDSQSVDPLPLLSK